MKLNHLHLEPPAVCDLVAIFDVETPTSSESEEWSRLWKRTRSEGMDCDGDDGLMPG